MFYEKLLKDKELAKYKDVFSSFIEESDQFKTLISRSYQEVITDAMEAAFPLKTLDERDYAVDVNVFDKLSFPEIKNKAVKVEETIKKFCFDASKSLSGLLADVPEEFSFVAKKKNQRIKKLKSL